MTPLDIAREKVLAAALSYAATRISLDVSQPGPHDDAQLELGLEMLDEAIGEYAQARQDELEGIERGG